MTSVAKGQPRMTFSERLNETISATNSLLCVGLDPDPKRMPQMLQGEREATLVFCKEIVAATAGHAAAFKINFAFFESQGSAGWQMLERLTAALPGNVLKIADAKRADIGNTSEHYASAILERLDFDAVTVNPYLGFDSVSPFLARPEKGAFILCLTSNPGSRTFQHLSIQGRPLYKKVAQEVLKWDTNGNCGLVVGATQPDELESVRNMAPRLPFLIPGIGAQGGALEEAVRHGCDEKGESALLNASRSILYKSSGPDFAEAAAEEARSLNAHINQHRSQRRSPK